MVPLNEQFTEKSKMEQQQKKLLFLLRFIFFTHKLNDHWQKLGSKVIIIIILNIKSAALPRIPIVFFP